jgi:hypothetical protein
VALIVSVETSQVGYLVFLAREKMRQFSKVADAIVCCLACAVSPPLLPFLGQATSMKPMAKTEVVGLEHPEYKAYAAPTVVVA